MQTEIQNKLIELSDGEYKKFSCSLMPTVDPMLVLGVRIPMLRRLAKELRGTAEAEDFISALPHTYYEENNLHGLLISFEKDFDRAVDELERLLPLVDNWATCDLLDVKVFAANKSRNQKRIDFHE